MARKILILYTSVGLGHKSIAENIGSVLTSAGYEVKLEDVLKVQKGWLVDFTTKLHYLINVYWPSLWSWLYNSTNTWLANLTLPLRINVASKNYYNTQIVVESFKPDIIISTHTTASGIVAFLKRQGIYSGKFGIAFSDFHLHRYWLYDEADFYLANIKEQKEEMINLGINAEKIFVCGIALAPKTEVDVEKIKTKLEIEPHKKVILVSGGSLGLGISEQLLVRLSQEPQFKIIVVTGKNEKFFARLGQLFAGSNVIVLGYFSPMDELYAIANIFVSKPGGLSTVEALRWHLPILVPFMLPGQEELNYSFLQEGGLIMPEPLNLESELLEELKGHNFKKNLLQNEHLQEVLPKPEVILEAINS